MESDLQNWTKKVTFRLIDGRWRVQIDIKEGATILTPRDVINLNRYLNVERRRQEMLYRRAQRIQSRKNEEQLRQNTEKVLSI